MHQTVLKQRLHLVVCWVFAVACVATLGCGGGDEGEKKPSSGSDSKPKLEGKAEKKEEGEKSAVKETGVGGLTGVITYSGATPELELLIEKGGDVRDANVCAANPIPNESIVVNSENMGLANVYVFLARAPKGTKTEAATDAVTLDQQGCKFVPHAVTVQVGQALKAISSDAVPHNIHTFPGRNGSVNTIVKPNDKEGLNIELTRPEAQPFKVKCDIHPWMEAYVLALDHPFMAITDQDGKFEIKDLPVGTHKLKIWQEKAGFLDKEYEVTIEKDGTTEVSLEYGADKFAVRNIPGLKTVKLSQLR